jgi:hypothetical protein
VKRGLVLAFLGVAVLGAVLVFVLVSGGGGAPTTTTESCAAAIAAATKTAPSVPEGAVLKESGTNGGGCFNR